MSDSVFVKNPAHSAPASVATATTTTDSTDSTYVPPDEDFGTDSGSDYDSPSDEMTPEHLWNRKRDGPSPMDRALADAKLESDPNHSPSLRIMARYHAYIMKKLKYYHPYVEMPATWLPFDKAWLRNPVGTTDQDLKEAIAYRSAYNAEFTRIRLAHTPQLPFSDVSDGPFTGDSETA
jgi:hypothetical protein